MPPHYSSKSAFFKNIREELRFWPYTIHQIDDTLDSSLIEGRAKQILFQALNSGLLTAFVGSGVSAAYGRMSWGEWKDEQLSFVTEISARFIELSEASLNLMAKLEAIVETESSTDPNFRQVWRWLRHCRQITKQARWEVKNLHGTFTAAKSDSGAFPGGEDLPVLFEIAKKLHDLLLRHRALYLPEDGSDPEDEDMFFGTRIVQTKGAPVKELAIIYKSLKRNCNEKLFEPFNACMKSYKAFALRPEAQMPFDQLAKVLLVDECAHAERLFFQGLSDRDMSGRVFAEEIIKEREDLRKDLNVASDVNLKRDIDGIRENAKRYRILSAFRMEKTRKIAQERKGDVPVEWRQILENLGERLQKYEGKPTPVGTNRVFLTPTSRFLVPMIWQLFENPIEVLKLNTRPEEVPELLREPGLNDFRSRRSIIAKKLDPLQKTINRLKIKRYLTTNYDFEIERQFQDQGYRRFDTHAASPAHPAHESEPGSRSFRTDGLGGVLKDMSFSTETAIDLLNFSVGAGAADASVFHLHGRATKEGKIVVTERDYMNLYLRQDLNRDIVDESILMAFAATPILFLGLGMEEADVLRPLRQFISDQDRSIGYQSIVLLPGDKDFDTRAKTSAGLYMRYGAHTIFFGGGEVEIKEDDQTHKQPVDWLFRVDALIKALRTAAKTRQDELLGLVKKETDAELKETDAALKDAVPDKLQRPFTTLKDLNKAVGTLGPDLINDVCPDPKRDVLPILLGVSQKNFDELARKAVNELEISDIEGFILQNCIFTTRRHSSGQEPQSQRQVATKGSDYTEFYVALLNDLMQLSLVKTNHASIGEALRSLAALQTALNGLQGAFLTATFNAALEGLEKEWRQWWQDWQQSPPEREPRFEEIVPPTKSDDSDDPNRNEVIFPRRLIRHRVVSVITDLSKAISRTAPAVSIDHEKMLAFGASDDLTGVRVFDTFIYDVAAGAVERSDATGRLFHTIAAARGQGKGVLFSIFATRLGVTSYLRAAHPKTGTGAKGKTQPFFMTCVFVNFSFSSEIASTYDMMLDTLLDLVAQLNVLTDGPVFYRYSARKLRKQALEAFLGSGPDLSNPKAREKVAELRGRINKTKDELKEELRNVPRNIALQNLMLKFQTSASAFTSKNCFRLKLRPRLLICLNALELLFDDQRRPKNMEIADFLRFLSSKTAGEVPFDIVCIGDFLKLGSLWDSDTRLQRVIKVRTDLPVTVQAAIRSMSAVYGVDAEKNVKGYNSGSFNFVHCVRPIDPLDFLVDNFLPLAIALFLARRQRADDGLIAAGEMKDAAKKAFDCYAAARNTEWEQNDVPNVNAIYLDSKEKLERSIVESLCESNVLPPKDTGKNWTENTSILRVLEYPNIRLTFSV